MEKETTMKTIPLKAISGMALTIILVLAAIQIPASGQNAKGRRIEGTWRVEVTARNCQSGAAIRTFPGLNTYLPGGSLIVTGASASPALISTGHGVWEHAGGRNFTSTVIFFRFNPDGTYAGTTKITRSIELDAADSDQLTSTESIELADPNGNVVGSQCATQIGHRLE
jgi:hypothetical protein